MPWIDQRLFDDVEHRHARVERAERVLKDELHLAAKPLQPVAVERQHVDQPAAIVERDRAVIGRHRAQQDLAERGLAAAAFADQPEAFAALDLQADVIDRDDLRRGAGEPAALADRIALADPDAFEQRPAGPRRPRYLLGHQMRRIAGGHLADRHQTLARLHVEVRHRAQQRAQIGMLGDGERCLRGCRSPRPRRGT